jgi:hypothetical protein
METQIVTWSKSQGSVILTGGVKVVVEKELTKKGGKPTARKRLLVASVIALLVTLIVVGVFWYQSTSWKRDLTVKYVEYVSNRTSGSDYYLYEITNNTNRTLRGVYARVEVLNLGNWKWTFDDLITSTLRVGETTEYKLFWSKVQKSAEIEGKELSWASVDIKQITYR